MLNVGCWTFIHYRWVGNRTIEGRNSFVVRVDSGCQNHRKYIQSYEKVKWYIVRVCNVWPRRAFSAIADVWLFGMINRDCSSIFSEMHIRFLCLWNRPCTRRFHKQSNFYSNYRYGRIFTQSAKICFRHIWTCSTNRVNGLIQFSDESNITAIFQIIPFPFLVLPLKSTHFQVENRSCCS